MEHGTHAGLFLNAHVRFYALLLFNVNYEGGAKKIASRSIFNLDTKGTLFVGTKTYNLVTNLVKISQTGKHRRKEIGNPTKSINQSINQTQLTKKGDKRPLENPFLKV